MFETVKYVYDNMPGKELRTLLPKFGCWFEEIVDGGRSCEKKKMQELSEDVHQMIEANIADNPEVRRKDPPPGIDSLLTLWVVIFMIIAFIVYAWC